MVACGDFHGTVPHGFEKTVRAVRPDIVLCTGDFYNNDALREIEFGWGNARKERAPGGMRDVYRRMVGSGAAVVARLDKIGVPVVAVYGNGDYVREDKKQLRMAPTLEEAVEQCNNVTLLKKRVVKIRGISIAGYSGYVGPSVKFRISAGATAVLRKERREIEGIFSKAEPGRTVFLTHDVPSGTAFEIVRYKASPLHGVRLGDEIYSYADLRYRPLLHVCGHMHEHQGSCRLGRTLVVAAGYGRTGKMAVIDINDGVRVRFISA